jgi:signal recognition particle subunit SRP68
VQEAEGKLEGLNGQEGKGVAGKNDTGRKKEKGSRSKKGVAAYDSILLALSDAEDVARKLVEAQQVWVLFTSRDPALTHALCFS